ncbi:hypothetical protein PMAYCL1PPCAC_27714, partial [Pristionchus mayeri]
LEWAAPILVVPKPNGKLRVCVDFSTDLNTSLEPHNHPLPVTSEIFTRLEIPVDEECRDLLGVCTHRGLFRFKRLPFGVSVAPNLSRVLECATISH